MKSHNFLMLAFIAIFMQSVKADQFINRNVSPDRQQQQFSIDRGECIGHAWRSVPIPGYTPPTVSQSRGALPFSRESQIELRDNFGNSIHGTITSRPNLSEILDLGNPCQGMCAGYESAMREQAAMAPVLAAQQAHQAVFESCMAAKGWEIVSPKTARSGTLGASCDLRNGCNNGLDCRGNICQPSSHSNSYSEPTQPRPAQNTTYINKTPQTSPISGQDNNNLQPSTNDININRESTAQTSLKIQAKELQSLMLTREIVQAALTEKLNEFDQKLKLWRAAIEKRINKNYNPSTSQTLNTKADDNTPVTLYRLAELRNLRADIHEKLTSSKILLDALKLDNKLIINEMGTISDNGDILKILNRIESEKATLARLSGTQDECQHLISTNLDNQNKTIQEIEANILKLQ